MPAKAKTYKARVGDQRITLDLPRELYASAKVEARSQGRAMRDVICALLAEWVKTAPRWRKFLALTAAQRRAQKPALRRVR